MPPAKGGASPEKPCGKEGRRVSGKDVGVGEVSQVWIDNEIPYLLEASQDNGQSRGEGETLHEGAKFPALAHGVRRREQQGCENKQREAAVDDGHIVRRMALQEEKPVERSGPEGNGNGHRFGGATAGADDGEAPREGYPGGGEP